MARAAASKPPRLECEQGRKWLVEHHVDNPHIVIADTNPRQAIYIFGCRNSTIQARRRALLQTMHAATYPHRNAIGATALLKRPALGCSIVLAASRGDCSL